MSETTGLMSLYERMLFIRRFEETSEKLYLAGKVSGSIHLGIGQEAIAVGVCSVLNRDDYISSTYRSRPQALAKGADPGRVLAEMLGRATGVCRGIGGPMHITDVENGVLVANAIVGAGVPIAAGAALRAKVDRTGQVSVVFFGEGATNQGVMLETLNLAALWRLPLVLVCENNTYAEMTPFADSVSVNDLGRRAEAFGVGAVRVDGNDVEAVIATALDAVAKARSGEGPVFLEADTYRFSGHMVGDPNTYRSKQEIADKRLRDPLVLAAARLRDTGVSDDQLDDVHRQVEEHIAQVVAFAEGSPYADLEFARRVTYV